MLPFTKMPQTLLLQQLLTRGQLQHRRFFQVMTTMVQQQRPQKQQQQRRVDRIQDGHQVRFLNTKDPGESENPTSPSNNNNNNTKKAEFDFKVPPGQFIEVDGVNIHYEKLGTGSEVLFMMPSGVGSTRIDYHAQLEGLDRNKFTLIAWDPPGFGFSRPPEREFPLDVSYREAHWGHKLLKTLGVEKTNVLGFCYGAIASMILAADRPEVVKKLVLLESYSYYTEEHMLRYEALRDIKNWFPVERQRMVDVYGEDYSVRQVHELLDHGIRILKTNGKNACMEKLSLIRCPTLLLNSKESEDVAQEHPLFMVNAIRDSRLIVLEKGSHFFLKQRPNLVNKIVTDFIFEDEEDDEDDYHDN